MSTVHHADDSAVRKRHEYSSFDQESETVGRKEYSDNSDKELLDTSAHDEKHRSNNDIASKEKQNNMDERSANEEQFKSSFSFYIPKRLIVTVLLGIGLLLVYSMRTNVGVTVIMILDERAYEKVGTIDAMINIPQVNWDSRMVGFLHSIFYVGFLISQVPGAFLTTILPAQKLYGGCILTSALLNLLLPVCIDNGEYSLVCSVRCVQGLAEGLLYPACYGVLRHWSAPSERSRQVSAVLSCAYAGAIVGFPLAGIITHFLGWQYIFYASGTLCIVWYMFWLCLVYEKPSHHKYISEEEFEFMDKSQGADVIDYQNVHVPWRSIVTSLPVISICLCHFVRYWISVLMLTNEPLYLNEFGFTIAETGVYAALPHIAKVILSFASGYIADSLLNSNLLSTVVVRKLLTGIGFGLQATGFLVLTFLYDGTSVIIVLTLTIGGLGLTTSGWSVNHYDLSTRYASSLVAVTSVVGSLGAIAAPLATGHFTMQQTIESWDSVFYLTSSIIAVAVIFYLIFGSGEQQHWSNPPSHICLVQKIDPLARKPYGTYTVQKTGNAKTEPFVSDDSAIKRPYSTYTVQGNTANEQGIKTHELERVDASSDLNKDEQKNIFEGDDKTKRHLEPHTAPEKEDNDSESERHIRKNVNEEKDTEPNVEAAQN